MEKNNLVGIRIKQMRLDKNWTQKDLADKLGLKNDTAIANYEANYSIPKDEIKIKMCELFNCSIDYLMGKSYYYNYQIRYSETLKNISFLQNADDTVLKILNIILSHISSKEYNYNNIRNAIVDELKECRNTCQFNQ